MLDQWPKTSGFNSGSVNLDPGIGRYDSDSAEKGLDSFIIRLLDFLLTTAGNTQLGKFTAVEEEASVSYSCHISEVLLLEG